MLMVLCSIEELLSSPIDSDDTQVKSCNVWRKSLVINIKPNKKNTSCDFKIWFILNLNKYQLLDKKYFSKQAFFT